MPQGIVKQIDELVRDFRATHDERATTQRIHEIAATLGNDDFAGTAPVRDAMQKMMMAAMERNDAGFVSFADEAKKALKQVKRGKTK